MGSDNQKLIKDFARFLARQKKSKSTQIAYQKDLEQLSELVGKDFSQIESSDIQRFLSESDLTPKTLSRKLNSFRTFYKYLTETKKISSNPALEVAHPKYKPSLPRVLSPVEYLALRQISSDNIRLSTMIELMLQTGIRIGELSRLKVGDVDIKKTKGYLYVEEYSTNPSRRVELNAKATLYLKKYMRSLHRVNKTAPLFATRDGKSIIIRNIRSSIDRAIEKAGIKNACVNDLRNTFIVYQLSQGAPLQFVTESVGHKSKSTTARYLELMEKKYTGQGESKVYEV